MSSQVIARDLATYLSAEGMDPTQAWLTSFLQSIDATRPIQALKGTARFRLLASDITQSVQNRPTSCFPSDILNGNVKERKLTGPILVQVLDVEDIGHSRWSQVEALEAAERGETTKGREVIRVVPGEDGNGESDSTTNSSAGPHKLVLQDSKGAKVFAIELSNVECINFNMNIGAKLLIKDVLVARAVLLLEPRNVQIIGGKIEPLHKMWREERKKRLQAAAGMTDGP